jgi:hypothetical protein
LSRAGFQNRLVAGSIAPLSTGLAGDMAARQTVIGGARKSVSRHRCWATNRRSWNEIGEPSSSAMTGAPIGMEYMFVRPRAGLRKRSGAAATTALAIHN